MRGCLLRPAVFLPRQRICFSTSSSSSSSSSSAPFSSSNSSFSSSSSSSSFVSSADLFASRAIDGARDGARLSSSLASLCVSGAGSAARFLVRSAGSMAVAVLPETQIQLPEPVLQTAKACKFVAELSAEAVSAASSAASFAARGVGQSVGSIFPSSQGEFASSSSASWTAATLLVKEIANSATELASTVEQETLATLEEGRAEISKLLRKSIAPETASVAEELLDTTKIAAEAAAKLKGGIAKDLMKDVGKGVFSKD